MGALLRTILVFCPLASTAGCKIDTPSGEALTRGTMRIFFGLLVFRPQKNFSTGASQALTRDTMRNFFPVPLFVKGVDKNTS